MTDNDNNPTARLGPDGLQPMRPGSGGLPRIAPAETPAESVKSTARGPSGVEPSQTTPKKIKWVPHTHPNPLHARFCYMCLHGALEGKEEFFQAKEVKSSVDDELPSAVEMRNRGYLQAKEHVRQLADFRRNNLPASWLRKVTREVYGQNKNLLLELNSQIAREDPRSPVAGGGTWFLIYEDEEKRDWRVVERLFELLPHDIEHLQEMQQLLTEYCRSRPLFIYKNPPPPHLEDWCKVTILPKEKKKVIYQPMADLSGLPADTQKLIGDMEEEAVRSGKTEDVIPWPSTLRRLGNFKIIPRQISNDEIPEYEPMEAPLPRRPDIPNIGDPFPKPNCYIHHFQEKGMPSFEVPYAEPQQFPPRKIDLEYMHPTVSYTMKHFPVPPYIDHVCWPPVEFITEFDEPAAAGFDAQLKKPRKVKRKKLLTRGLWEPEMVTMRGNVLPPYMERVRKERHSGTERDFDEMQVDDSIFVTLKGGTKLVQDMINVIVVRSFAKFPPAPTKLEFPEFLNNIATVDWTNETPFDVIEQRHKVLIKEMEREEKEFMEAQLHEEQLQALENDPYLNDLEGMEDEENQDFKVIDDDEQDESNLPTEKPEEKISEQTRREQEEQDAIPGGPSGVSDTTIRPDVGQVEEADHNASRGAPIQSAGSAEQEESAGSHQSGIDKQTSDRSLRMGGTAEEGVPVTPPPGSMIGATAGQPTLKGETVMGQSPGPNLGGIQAPTLQKPPQTLTKDQIILQRHQKRLEELIEKEKEEKRIEQLLTKDRFLDNLAAKISEKMSVQAALSMSPTRGPGRHDPSREPWHPGMEFQRPGGDLTNYRTPVGSSMLQIQPPPQPNFLDDDDLTKIEGNKLPRPLRGDDVVGPTPALKQQPGADVNAYTQERARGDAYVRLITKPDEEGSRKHTKPYQPILMEPDENLILGDQFHLKKKKPEGALEDEDFEDLEDSNAMLFSFVRHNRYDALQSLLEQDTALIYAQDENQNTLLHIACQNNHRRIAKLLIRAGVELDVQNNKGNTALHYCYAYNFMPLAGVLLSKGADDSLTNNFGLPPSRGIAPPETEVGLAKHEKAIERAIKAGNPQTLDPSEKLRPK